MTMTNRRDMLKTGLAGAALAAGSTAASAQAPQAAATINWRMTSS